MIGEKCHSAWYSRYNGVGALDAAKKVMVVMVCKTKVAFAGNLQEVGSGFELERGILSD